MGLVLVAVDDYILGVGTGLTQLFCSFYKEIWYRGALRTEFIEPIGSVINFSVTWNFILGVFVDKLNCLLVPL
jgi:hypothetical protein